MFEAAHDNSTEMLAVSDLAHNLLVGDHVEIDPTAQIGANVVIHSNVVIAAGAVIKHNAVIGALPTLADDSRSDRLPAGETYIGPGATICIGAIVMGGARIGSETIIGDYAYIRERVVTGIGCRIGRATGIGASARLGDRVNIQTLSGVAAAALVEDDVFIGPGVMFSSDDTMARRDAAERTQTVIRRGTRIGSGVTLTPGLQIGPEAFIAAGAVVARDVGQREKVRGVPARVYGAVADEELLDNWR
ncbi:MAG: N-acetyltransferase [Solirubrobacterales bacterium]